MQNKTQNKVDDTEIGHPTKELRRCPFVCMCVVSFFVNMLIPLCVVAGLLGCLSVLCLSLSLMCSVFTSICVVLLVGKKVARLMLSQ